jgi:iron(III) transport system permease protein
MADFGNPLVLGGNFDVLSTEIFFAIVGAQYDQAQAAMLAIVLLIFHAVCLLRAAFLAWPKSRTQQLRARAIPASTRQLPEATFKSIQSRR